MAVTFPGIEVQQQETEHTYYHREIIERSGKCIKQIILGMGQSPINLASKKNYSLQELSSIKALNHNLDHVLVNCSNLRVFLMTDLVLLDEKSISPSIANNVNRSVEKSILNLVKFSMV
jgi:hypothetical protein